MYLEAAVEGGVVAFLGLIAFFIWLVRVAKSIPHLPSWQKSYLVLTPVAFCLGGLTQNAIQDAEVRFTLLGFVGVLLATATRQASKSP